MRWLINLVNQNQTLVQILAIPVIAGSMIFLAGGIDDRQAQILLEGEGKPHIVWYSQEIKDNNGVIRRGMPPKKCD